MSTWCWCCCCWRLHFLKRHWNSFLSILLYIWELLILFAISNQGKSFKTRATEVKDGLKEKVPGITVKVNPKKVCSVFSWDMFSNILKMQNFVWESLYTHEISNVTFFLQKKGGTLASEVLEGYCILHFGWDWAFRSFLIQNFDLT